VDSAPWFSLRPAGSRPSKPPPLIGSCIGAQLDAAEILQHNHVTGLFDVLLAVGFPILGRILAYWPSPARDALTGIRASDPGQGVFA